MRSVPPRRSRRLWFFLSRAINQRQTGICVVKNSWPGSATMQSTRSASIKALRISPSFEVCVDIEPFAMLNPGVVGVVHRRHPEFPAHVLPQIFAAPIAHVERRVGENEIGLEVGMQIRAKTVGATLAEIGV